MKLLWENATSTDLALDLVKMLNILSKKQLHSISKPIIWLVATVEINMYGYLVFLFFYIRSYGPGEMSYFILGTKKTSVDPFLLLQIFNLNMACVSLLVGTSHYIVAHLIVISYSEGLTELMSKSKIDTIRLENVKVVCRFIDTTIVKINGHLKFHSICAMCPLWLCIIFSIPLMMANRNLTIGFALGTIGYFNFVCLSIFIYLACICERTNKSVEKYRSTADKLASYIICAASQQLLGKNKVLDALSLHIFLTSNKCAKTLAFDLVPIRKKLILPFFNSAIPYTIVVFTSMYQSLVD